jgi:hypothetical protein
MLITVIKTATVPVKTSQMPSIGDERHISDGKNASATTRYRMPKPTSTHFTRIASPRHVRVMSALPPKADQSLLGLPETAPAPRLLRANPRLGWNGFALSPQVGAHAMPWGRGLDVNAQHLTLPRLFPVNRSAGHAGDIAIKKLSVGFITRGPWPCSGTAVTYERAVNQMAPPPPPAIAAIKVFHVFHKAQ